MRPWFRRLAIAAFVVLLPIAAHSLWDYFELRRLVREVDAIRAKGEPVSEHDAGRGYRRLSDDEELAARYFMAAAIVGYPTMQKNYRLLDAVQAHVRGLTPRDFDLERERQRIAGVAAAAAPAFTLVDRAVTLPFRGYAPGTSYNYRASELYAMLQLLAIRTIDLSLSGDADGAVQAAITSIKARPATNESRVFFRYTGDQTPIVLSFCAPSPAALRQLLAALQAEDRDDVYQETLADRASFLERIFREFYGADPRAPAAYKLPYRGFPQTLWRPVFTHRLVTALRAWNELVAASRKSWPEKGREMDAIVSRFSQPSRPGPPFSGEALAPPRRVWWFPQELDYPLAMFPRRTMDLLIADRAARAAVAVALYRAAHGGQLPRTLEELRPAYLTDVPQDPATGGPLLYRSDDRSYTVYSTGPDRKDDGGDLVSDLRAVEQRGWGRRLVHGKDVGVRVLLNAANKEASSPAGSSR